MMLMEAVDVAKQAQQGSMAAIIQILNERLADRGVRTRAVLIDGVLQLLCEATEEASLEQSSLVPQVREILEDIDPRHLKRVNIFGRIAQEQQMLWLEDMARNPDHSILWTEQITLRRSPFWQRWWPTKTTTPTAVASASPEPDFDTELTALDNDELDIDESGSETPTETPLETAREAPPASSHSSPVLRNILGLVTLCIVSFIFGQYYEQWRSKPSPQAETVAPSTTPSPTPSASPSPQPTTVVISPTSATPTVQPQSQSPVLPAPTDAASPDEDAFTRAVRLAEEASLGGQEAKTAGQWQALVKKWQEASKLMQSVPDSDERSAVARDRSKVYQDNSQLAQKKVQELQALPTPP
ncbi:MAG: hypothetical protein F6J87_30260 [Spirulina sp. SIO3F2]|nr:hypothetical protein [Spirulina sp. SIO3F2]